jgi:hypothetical protein
VALAKPSEHIVGIGLVDFLMTETVTEIGVTYPAWNVQNIKEYKNMERDQKIGGVPKIHVLKTNQHSAGQQPAPIHLFPLMAGVRIAC